MRTESAALPRFGIAFQSDKTPAEYRGLAEIVDHYAFDVVSVYNDLLFQPALGPLLWMAPVLTRAQLGPAALNPYTLHPLEIAGQVALLDRASGGRAYLGLARGAWLDRIGVAQRRPVQTLRETVLLVRHLLGRRPEAFSGEVFRHAASATLQYAPLRPSVPVTIGTWGRATARMAGEVADEIKVGGSANPAMVSMLRPAVHEGCARAGRPFGAVGICLGAVTVVHADRALARGLARREMALYLTVVAELDPEIDPEWLARVRTASVRHDVDAIARDISDDVLDRFAFAGSPRDVVRQVERLADSGAARVEFGTPLGPDPAEGIRLLGEQVLPAFRTTSLVEARR
jgi:5,10-methylenetetrahydromethanopterin reductase